MTQGTGTGAYFGKLSAGKTGTTDNYADAWFCGFTPGLEATIWIGYPRGEIPMRSVHGIEVSGPTFPATIWKLFMEEAIGPTPVRDFPESHSEPIWHSFSPGSYGGPPPPSSYYYVPPAPQPPAGPQPPAAPPPPARATPHPPPAPKPVAPPPAEPPPAQSPPPPQP